MLWFAALMAVFFLLEVPLLGVARASDVKAVEWGWIGVMFATLGGAALITVGGMVLAVIAIVRRKERSGLLLAPILLGAFVLFFAIGEAGGPDKPASDGPGGGQANGHSNTSAVEVAPGEVRVSFNYIYTADPSGARIEAITVRPLTADGTALRGYVAWSSPVGRGSGHMGAVLELTAAELAEVTGFSICFAGSGMVEQGCAEIGYAHP